MLIPASSLKKNRWKNDGGFTTEIARDRNGDFDWRLSFAEVEKDGPFSEFPGCDRLLVVWQGPGLRLISKQGPRENQKDLRAFEIFSFSGDARFECQLVGAPVVDLGLIYRRDRISAQMTVLPDLSRLPDLGELNFIFATSSDVSIGDVNLRISDTVRFPKTAPPKLRDRRPNATDIKAIHVALNRLKTDSD